MSVGGVRPSCLAANLRFGHVVQPDKHTAAPTGLRLSTWRNTAPPGGPSSADSAEDTAVLWRFIDHQGRSAVCRLVERREMSVLRMELEYAGYTLVAETYRDMATLERRSREYHDHAVAEGWIELTHARIR
jgi:hypothetical protein